MANSEIGYNTDFNDCLRPNRDEDFDNAIRMNERGTALNIHHVALEKYIKTNLPHLPLERGKSIVISQ